MEKKYVTREREKCVVVSGAMRQMTCQVVAVVPLTGGSVRTPRADKDLRLRTSHSVMSYHTTLYCGMISDISCFSVISSRILWPLFFTLSFVTMIIQKMTLLQAQF